MALFGKESQADSQRARRVKQWAQERTPTSLFAMMFGMMALVDAWTMVIGVMAGLAAIALGVRGQRELAHLPDKRGRRLCQAGVVMGAAGLALSVIVWCFLN